MRDNTINLLRSLQLDITELSEDILTDLKEALEIELSSRIRLNNLRKEVILAEKVESSRKRQLKLKIGAPVWQEAAMPQSKQYEDYRPSTQPNR